MGFFSFSFFVLMKMVRQDTLTDRKLVSDCHVFSITYNCAEMKFLSNDG